MRPSRLVLICCFCAFAIFGCQAKTELSESKQIKTVMIEFPEGVLDKESLLFWGEHRSVWGPKQGGYCRVFEYSNGNHQAIVLLEDIGSGVHLDRIYLFGKSTEMKDWRFVLFRPTCTEVNVYQEKDKLIFTTVSGDVLLEQSFDTLVL